MTNPNLIKPKGAMYVATNEPAKTERFLEAQIKEATKGKPLKASPIDAPREAALLRLHRGKIGGRK